MEVLLWWEKEGLKRYPLNEIYLENEWFLEPKLNRNERNVSCMVEALWAIREGLA